MHCITDIQILCYFNWRKSKIIGIFIFFYINIKNEIDELHFYTGSEGSITFVFK